MSSFIFVFFYFDRRLLSKKRFNVITCAVLHILCSAVKIMVFFCYLFWTLRYCLQSGCLVDIFYVYSGFYLDSTLIILRSLNWLLSNSVSAAVANNSKKLNIFNDCSHWLFRNPIAHIYSKNFQTEALELHHLFLKNYKY